MFVHTASNSLKKHIPYISRSDLGLTKEMGMKMITIMTDMIHFIKGEAEDQSSQQSNQVFAHNSQEHQHIKQERIAARQRIIRELQLIDVVIQILYYPFNGGNYRIKELKRGDNVTMICRTAYFLLKFIVKDNRINELYASQWILLFFE